MADIVFNKFKQALGGGNFATNEQILTWDSDVAGASTIKVMLISGDLASSANPNDLDTVNDVLSVVSPEAVSEYSGSYSKPSLTNRQVTVDDGNNRSEFDADDITISALPSGTANVDGLLVYWVPTGSAGEADHSDNVPLIYFDLAGAGADFMGNGGDITIQFNAQGVVQVT